MQQLLPVNMESNINSNITEQAVSQKPEEIKDKDSFYLLMFLALTDGNKVIIKGNKVVSEEKDSLDNHKPVSQNGVIQIDDGGSLDRLNMFVSKVPEPQRQEILPVEDIANMAFGTEIDEVEIHNEGTMLKPVEKDLKKIILDSQKKEIHEGESQSVTHTEKFSIPVEPGEHLVRKNFSNILPAVEGPEINTTRFTKDLLDEKNILHDIEGIAGNVKNILHANHGNVEDITDNKSTKIEEKKSAVKADNRNHGTPIRTSTKGLQVEFHNKGNGRGNTHDSYTGKEKAMFIVDTPSRNSHPAITHIEPGATPFADSNKILSELTHRLVHTSSSGVHIVRIKLEPEDLGEIFLKISVKNNHLKAFIEVDHQHIKDIIDTNMSKLVRDLNTHGLTLEQFIVSARGDGGGGYERFDTWTKNHRSATARKMAFIPENTQEDYVYMSNLNIVA